MLEITPRLTSSVQTAIQSYAASRPSKPAPEASGQADDQVDLSAAASEYDATATQNDASQARISQLRELIAADKYLTDDKIDYVVERLFAEVRGSVAQTS